MIRRGVCDRPPITPIKRINIKVKQIKVGTMGITIESASIFEMETTTETITSTGVTMVTKMIEVGPMFILKIGKLLLEMVEVVWCELKIC